RRGDPSRGMGPAALRLRPSRRPRPVGSERPHRAHGADIRRPRHRPHRHRRLCGRADSQRRVRRHSPGHRDVRRWGGVHPHRSRPRSAVVVHLLRLADRHQPGGDVAAGPQRPDRRRPDRGHAVVGGHRRLGAHPAGHATGGRGQRDHRRRLRRGGPSRRRRDGHRRRRRPRRVAGRRRSSPRSRRRGWLAHRCARRRRPPDQGGLSRRWPIHSRPMATDSTRSERLRRIALLVWSTLGALALMWVFLRVADSVRVIWLPLAFAGGFTLLLNPLVNSLERVHVPRVVGTSFAFLVAGSVIAAIVVLLVPTIREQGADLATTLPNLYTTIVDWLESVSESLGVDFGSVWTSTTIEEWVSDPQNQRTIQEILGGFGSGAGMILRGVTETIAVALLAPVLAFYMLMDATKFKQRARELTPPQHREE